MLDMFFGKVIETVGGLIDKSITDKDEAARLKHELSLAILGQVGKDLETQASVIIAEAKGESPAQRNWRPHLMYLIMGLLVYNGVVVPLLNAWGVALMRGAFGVEIPPLPILEAWTAIPDNLWTLLQIGVGGYIVGRTGEKIAGTMTRPK